MMTKKRTSEHGLIEITNKNNFGNWLYPKQRKAIFSKKRYAIIEASTKSGKTIGCSAWLTEKALKGRPGQNFWWVAPVLAQSKIVFRRLKRAIPSRLYTSNESELTLTFCNGPVMWFKGADHPDTLYGEDVYAAVIDEATRVKKEAFHAVRTTLTATRGPIRIIGNVKGRKNWAYRMARKAEAGEPNMHYARLTAEDAVEAGVLHAEEIEDAKRQMPAEVFQELYCAVASDDAGNPFGLAAIEAAIIASLSTDEPVVWGIDLAKSVDWVVSIGLDALGRVCGFERWQGPWEETIRRIIDLVGPGYAFVDSTGVGCPVLEALQRPSKSKGGTFEGYVFSSASKQKLMEGLAIGIQQNEIWFPDGVIAAELREFEYEYTRTGVLYSAPAGMHDDCVCSLALAWYGLRGKRGGLLLPGDLHVAGERVSISGTRNY